MRIADIKGWIASEKLPIQHEPDQAGRAPERPVAVPNQAPPTAAASSADRRLPPAPIRWPVARVAAVESLWGHGFVTPGGAPEAIRLAKPLGLTNKATLLLVGGGLGGPATAIAGAFGTWVASLEAEPALAAIAATRRSVLDESASRITLAGWNPAKPDFQARSANHALALEALRGAPSATLIEGLSHALRPQGQIIMTELVADALPERRDREFAAWCRLENRTPELPRPDDISAAFVRRRFDVRVVEDISDRHVTQTLAGWREAVQSMGAHKPEAAQAGAFVSEAELWLLRIRLMRRLGLRLMRWHAIGLA